MLWDEINQIDFSPSVYLGGYRALNIYSEKGSGDWHSVAYWDKKASLKPTHIMGLERFNSFYPSQYLDDDGVFLANDKISIDGKKFQKPIYASTHARACADLIIIGSLRKNPYSHFTLSDLDDFMPTTELKEEVYNLLKRHIDKYPKELKQYIENWITKAQEKIYD